MSIDTSAAEKMPGVKAVHIVQGPGANIHWAGDDIVAVAAVDEPTAEDAIRAIKVKFQQLPHLVSDAEPPKGSAQEEGPLSVDAIDDMLDNQVPANQMVSTIQRDGLVKKASEDELKMLKADGATDAVLEAIGSATIHPEASSKPPSNYQKAAAQTLGEPDKAFAEADVVSEGLYGMPVITHCCLESHGSISEWTDQEHLFTHISTQNVSGIPGQMAEPLKGTHGYIVEVQGFSSGKGQAAIATSRKMADAVVRYLVENHEIPVYRIYVLGMGNAPAPAASSEEKPKRMSGGRVEVSLLKNDLEQLANSNTTPAPAQ